MSKGHICTMNVIIIYYFLLLCSPARAMASCSPAQAMASCSPALAMASSFTRFRDHTQNDAPKSVVLLRTSDQLVAETST
jgi:hypothetical protein